MTARPRLRWSKAEIAVLGVASTWALMALFLVAQFALDTAAGLLAVVLACLLFVAAVRARRRAAQWRELLS